MLYGLTGNPGTGKSIVAGLLKKKGIEILMLYDNFKELGKNVSIIKKHYLTFGNEIIKEDKYLLSKKENDKKFELFKLNKDLLLYLFDNINLDGNYYLNKNPIDYKYILENNNDRILSEKIFLDDIKTEITDFEKTLQNKDIGLIKYSKIIENNLLRLFTGILITTSPEELQYKRLKSKGYNEKQINQLIEDRYNLEHKIKILESNYFDNLNNLNKEDHKKFYYVISTEKNINEIEKEVDFFLSNL